MQNIFTDLLHVDCIYRLILYATSVRISPMDAVLIGRISQETAIPESSVSATVALFEKGATGPFIVHYRKEATGGLDEAKVRLIQERMDYYREVRDKQSALKKSLSEQNKLTDEIRARIESYLTKVELDDLHHQFRSRKKTRSTAAIEKGLEPLAEYFWGQEPDAWSVEEHINVFVDASRELSTAEEALQGVVDIIAEWISEKSEYRHTLREMLEQDGFLISNVVPAKVNQKTKYNMYYERRESVRTIPSHRVLAIRRGCKEGILISSIEGDHAKAQEFLLSSAIKDRESIFSPVLEAAVHESYTRILRPLVETEVRTQLKEKADREAIRVFQENLTNLLLSPPIGPLVVMGVDCGKDDECSIAVVDGTGAYLEKAKIRFKPSGKTGRTKKENTSPRKAKSSDATTTEHQADTRASSASPETESPETEQPAETNSADSTKDTTQPESQIETDTNVAVSETSDKPAETIDTEGQAPTGTPEIIPADSAATAPVSPAGDTVETPDKTQEKPLIETAVSETELVAESPTIADDATTAPADALQVSPSEADATLETVATLEKGVEEAKPQTVDDHASGDATEPSPGDRQSPPEQAEQISTQNIPASQEEPTVRTDTSETTEVMSITEPVSDVEAEPKQATVREDAIIKDTPPIEPLIAPTAKEEDSEKDEASVSYEASVSDEASSTVGAEKPGNELEKTRKILKDLITKHKVQALSIGTGTKARELETALRQIITEENLGDILIAAVNDAGIAIYSSSRIAREEFSNWNPSARCAVSLARRLQDPLAELVKIDPKLIGVGQYQHDVDQKELHRKLLRTVQFCVNKVGANINTAGEPLLRYISGLNEKIARRITAHRKNQGSFPTREAIPSAVGMDAAVYEQAAGFLRVPNSENVLDRTAVHPESYPIVQAMASFLEIEIGELVGNREKIKALKLEDFKTDTAGIPTIKDIRDELFKPGRDPRKTFRLPKFSPDVTVMTDLKTGITLEGTITNVTNFGAFVDIGVQQDGLVHLSQMSNRFIRDPREAVKVGDIVQVKVISVETETKRIGLSMKALLPAIHKRRRKPQQSRDKQSHPGKKTEGSTTETNTGTRGAASSSRDRNTTAKGRSKPNRPHTNASRPRKKATHKPEKADAFKEKKEAAPETPKRSLQEKIAILQSKFRGIN